MRKYSEHSVNGCMRGWERSFSRLAGIISDESAVEAGVLAAAAARALEAIFAGSLGGVYSIISRMYSREDLEVDFVEFVVEVVGVGAGAGVAVVSFPDWIGGAAG